MVKGYIVSDPFTSSSEELFWDPESENERYAVIGPSMKSELNKASSFEFTVLPSNGWYNGFNRKKTVIRIYDNGSLLFDGRVSSISVDFYKQKRVSCESALAYLMDSLQPGDMIQDGTITEVENNGYHSESTEEPTIETIIEHLTRLLNQHNVDTDRFKRIYLGNVRSKGGNQYFDASGYRTTWEAIESDLIERFGGYVQIRRGRSSSGEDPNSNYLDYLPIEDLTGNLSNTMTFGENIVELTQQEDEDDEIYTVLLAFGKEIELDVDVDEDRQKKVRYRVTVEDASNAVTSPPSGGREVDPYRDPRDPRYIIVSPAALEKYGTIFRCMDFDDRETPEELYSRAVEYIYDTCGFRTTYEVKAVDIHNTNPSARARTMLGDRVHIRSSWHGIDDHSLYVKSAQYDLENPENDTFTIGVPYQEREDKKISSSTSDATKGSAGSDGGGIDGSKGSSGGYGGGYSGGGGYGGSILDNYIKYVDGRLEWHTAWIAEVVDIDTGRSTRLEQDERHIALTADAIIGHIDGESTEEQYNRLSRLEVGDTGVHCIVQIQDDHGNKLVNHESRVEMNEDQIQLYTGNMYVEEESVTFTEVASTSITSETNPNNRHYWERVNTDVALDVHDPRQFKITPDTAPTEGKIYYTKAVGKSSVVLAEGAGLFNEKDQTRYGLWDEGNLTSGVLCSRINEPEYVELSAEAKHASQLNGVNPSTAEPWWWEKDTHGDFIRSTDPVVIESNSYWIKSPAQTETQIIGKRIIVGATADYAGMDAANKAKVDRYLAGNNLDSTITEIASDVVVVNTLLAKYIEADRITANTSLRSDRIYCYGLHVMGTQYGRGDGLTASRVSAGEWYDVSGVDGDASSGSINLKRNWINHPFTLGGSDENKAFVPSTSGDIVTITYGTMDGKSHSFSFTKPASLGAVTWSSGSNGGTLTAKTVGGADFLVGSVAPFSPSGQQEAQQMTNAGYLATETTGYSTVYGITYMAKGTDNSDISRKTMLFKTPRNRYPDAVSTIRTYSNWAKGDGQTIELGYSGSATVFAQYRTESQFDANSGVTNLGGVTVTSPRDRYSEGKTDGANSLTISPSSYTNMSYSQSVTVTAYATRGDGTTASRSVTLKAPADNSTPHSINIPNNGFDTRTSNPGGTLLVNMRDAIQYAVEQKLWFYFEVDCGTAAKTYVMDFT